MATAPAGIAVQELNPVQHQRKAVFAPTKPVVRPVPARPANPAVQRVAAPVAEPTAVSSVFAEMEAEFAQPAPGTEAAPVTTEGADDDVETILKRFKGSPEEVARQIAKSYKESEKRMRHLEAERKLIGQPAQSAAPVQPAAPPQAPTNQVTVIPKFDYGRFKKDILDHGDQVAQDFEGHIVSIVNQRLAEAVTPLYGEAINTRLRMEYPDVVTGENIAIIKAMAQNESGDSTWNKLVSAVTKYKGAMGTNSPTPATPNADVQAMVEATATPTPTARPTGEKKMWKESVIRTEMNKLIRSGEYRRDPKWRNLFDTAYREGRVLRGQ